MLHQFFKNKSATLKLEALSNIFSSLPVQGNYGEEYKLNSLGYRCGEFDLKNGLRSIAVGCSDVFGWTMPHDELFHEIVIKELGLPITHWNLGFCGASNDKIARILCNALHILKPHLVFVSISYSNRREMFDEHGNVYGYIGHIDHFDPNIEDKYCQYIKRCENVYQNLANTYRNMHWMLCMCQAAGVEFLYNNCDQAMKSLIPIFPFQSRYCGFFETIDFASDKMHPGKMSNTRLAQLYLQKIRELKIVEKLGSINTVM